MGYIDKQLELALAAAVFSTGTVKYSDTDFGNIIDRLKKGDSLEPEYLFIRVSTAFAGGTSAQIKLLGDTVAPIDASSTVLHDFGAIAVASLPVNTILRIKLPLDLPRILGLSVTCVGTVTAGSIDAWIGQSLQANDSQS